MANRLAGETSPYLLQHKDNPVDWRPWGSEALEDSRESDRPLLVSIGYSACHWCHVMERECFEDPEIAGLMNQWFVCVKVDREERPDVDAIYMDAVQTMTGHGGWPLNVFVTPEQVPFYGGTYFPPQPRQGMPSWPQVLEAVATAWQDRKGEIRESAGAIVERLRGGATLAGSEQPIDVAALGAAVEQLRQTYDAARGGWGGAPKFPQASVIEFLLRRGETEMAVGTLLAMAEGGIYDQVGGGFSRYAVDATWTVPHFEKMLYDNALLARAYLHGFQVAGDEGLARVCTETLDWALREMRGPEHAFYAALDADSEGVEGKYYVWSAHELRDVLGEELGGEAVAFFGATGAGNFEGSNVLEARGPRPERLPEIRCKLYGAREQRVRPGLDDKRLTAWNALMIGALADAGAVLEREDYLDAARLAADFLLTAMRPSEGILLRTHNDGSSKLPGYLEDYAFSLEALLTLYEATFEERWFVAARELGDAIVERFADAENGGFFSTEETAELLVRRKELEDSPIPAGGSSAAYGLLRLAALTGESSYEEHATAHLRLLHEIAPRHPGAFGHLLQAIDFLTAPTREVALVGPPEQRHPLDRVVREQFRPHIVLAAGEGEGAAASGNVSGTGDGSGGAGVGPGAVVPLLAGRTPIEGRVAAYVCEAFACKRPVTEPDALRELLGD